MTLTADHLPTGVTWLTTPYADDALTITIASGLDTASASEWTGTVRQHAKDTGTLFAPTVTVDATANSVTFGLAEADLADLIATGESVWSGFWRLHHQTGAEMSGVLVVDMAGTRTSDSGAIEITVRGTTIEATFLTPLDATTLVPASRPTVAGIMPGFGHSMANIGPGARTAALSGQHYAGDDVLVVATAGSLAPGKWRIRESGDQTSEHVTIAPDVDCSGTVVKITSPLVNDHANGVTVVDPAPYCGERIGRMLSADYRNRAISGSTLCKAGAPGTANYGGFNRPLRELPVPPGASGASTSPAPGLFFLFTLLNDFGDANLTAAGSTKIINAARHALRALLARAMTGRLFESETAFPASSIYTTFTGTFATVNSTTQNTGTGYESGAGTITHTPPAGWAGPAGSPTRCVDFGWIANYEGGGFAASEIHFTVDGTEVYPIGSNSTGPYSASNPFTTVDQNPATFGTGLATVARIPVTPTGGSQTIVATTGAGGACFDWVGWEADFIMPTILPNVFVTPGCTAQQKTAIPLMNTALQAVVDEFDSPYICVPDLYTALSPAGVPGDFWNTAVDTTHVDAARGHLKIAEVCVEAFQALSLPIAQKASL